LDSYAELRCCTEDFLEVQAALEPGGQLLA